ncbi:MAG TPA: GDSL-type esterase/lipase family protein [Verrucomicrobiae bacterium]
MNLVRVSSFLCALLISILVTSCSGKREHRNYPPTATGDWIAFGDSLTYGYGASRGKDYPTLLAQKLGVRIENQGISGQTTGQAMGRVDAAARKAPRVVLLCLGGNDGLQKIPRETMFKNLSDIISAFHAEGSFVVLIGVRSATLRDKNEEGFEELAERKRVLYISDILEGLFTDPRYMSDQIHPNDKGYEMIADRLAKELQPLMEKLK